MTQPTKKQREAIGDILVGYAAQSILYDDAIEALAALTPRKCIHGKRCPECAARNMGRLAMLHFGDDV